MSRDSGPNPNSAPTLHGQKQQINTQAYFDKISQNESPLSVRENLVRAVL